MTITAGCSACESQFRVKDEHAGKLVRCPACAEPVRIPSAGPVRPSSGRPPQKAATAGSEPSSHRPSRQAKSQSASRRAATRSPSRPPSRPRAAVDRGTDAIQVVSISPRTMISGIVCVVVLAALTAFLVQQSSRSSVSPMQAASEESWRRQREFSDAAHQRHLDIIRAQQPSSQPRKITPSISNSQKSGSNIMVAEPRKDPTTGKFESTGTAQNKNRPSATNEPWMPKNFVGGSGQPASAANSSSGVQSQLVAERSAASMDQSTGEEMSWADLNELIEPSVVKVNVKSIDGEGSGSGFVVDDAGLAVTNYHVVEGATEVVLRFANGGTVRATGYVHLDAKRDIAIVRFEPSRLTRAPRGLPLAIEKPRKGDGVAAFGAPLGLDFTFTQSNVSAVRTAKDLEQMLHLPDQAGTWIQHSAPISSGNSGGPLVNRQGQVVAMNTMTLTIGQNLNFAISAADILRAMQMPLPSDLPVVPASVPVIHRSPEESGKEASGENPFAGRERDLIDVTKDDRGRQILAKVETLGLLILAFSLDEKKTVSGAVRDAARLTLEQSGINVRSITGQDQVMLIGMALERSGQKKLAQNDGSGHEHRFCHRRPATAVGKNGKCRHHC